MVSTEKVKDRKGVEKGGRKRDWRKVEEGSVGLGVRKHCRPCVVAGSATTLGTWNFLKCFGHVIVVHCCNHYRAVNYVRMFDSPCSYPHSDAC